MTNVGGERGGGRSSFLDCLLCDAAHGASTTRLTAAAAAMSPRIDSASTYCRDVGCRLMAPAALGRRMTYALKTLT
jgi:hypothetical protein